MERKGSGFGKIINAYENQVNYTEVKKPVFKSDRYQFTVVMPNLNYDVAQDVTKDVTKDVTNSSQEEKIIAMIKEDAVVTQTEMAEELGVTTRTIKRILARMQKMGSVSREGTSRSGKWVINK